MLSFVCAPVFPAIPEGCAIVEVGAASGFAAAFGAGTAAGGAEAGGGIAAGGDCRSTGFAAAKVWVGVDTSTFGAGAVASVRGFGSAGASILALGRGASLSPPMR